MRSDRAACRLLLISGALMGLIASSAIIWGVIRHGRVIWKVAGVRILRASHVGGSLAVLGLSVVTLVYLLKRRWFRRMVHRLNMCDWLFVGLLLFAAYAGLSGGHRVHGDGVEYILQTQSLVFDRCLAIDTEGRRPYWNATNPYGIALEATSPAAETVTESTQAGGGFGGLYPDRSGRYRYYHFWLYSAWVAPVYALFHAIDPGGDLEYFAFRFVNVCLFLTFLLFAYRQVPRWRTLAILVLLVVSPLIAYCDWQHPEIFCLTLVFLSLRLATGTKSVFVSPFLLGLACSMNLPIVFFFPLLFAVAVTSGHPVHFRGLVRLVLAHAGGVLVGLSSLAYFMVFFRVPSVIAHVGLASLDYASLARVCAIFFSPLVGAVWFFPLSLLGVALCVTRRNAHILLVAIGGVAAAAWLASSSANLNAGQVGTVRYAVWLLAPLWYCLFQYLPLSPLRARRGILLSLALGLNLVLVLYLRTYELVDKKIERFGGAWRAHPEVARLVRIIPFHEDAEILAENIIGDHLPTRSHFRGIYVWDLGHDECIWVLSGDAIWRRRPVLVRVETRGDFAVTARPQQALPLEVRGDMVRIGVPDTVDPCRHPVLGDYLELRTRGKILGIQAVPGLVVRSDTVREEESLYKAWHAKGDVEPE